MAMQVRVLYDFDGEVENGELVIRENQVLTVIRQDVGDGWWEAETANKQRGLIPEAYVQEIVDDWDGPEYAPPPPPPPSAESSVDQELESATLPAPPAFDSQMDYGADSWNRPDQPPPPPPADDEPPYSTTIDPWDKLEQEQQPMIGSQGPPRQDSVGNEDDWDDDDDWDDHSAPQEEEQHQKNHQSKRSPPKNISKPWMSNTVPRKGSASRKEREDDATYCNAQQVASIGKSRSFHHGKLSTFQSRHAGASIGSGNGGRGGGSFRITLPNRPLEMPPTPCGAVDATKSAQDDNPRVGHHGVREMGHHGVREMGRGDSTETYESDEDSSLADHDTAVNGSANFGLSGPNRQYKQRNSDASVKPTGTVKKNFASRFSVFAKSGGEAYLLGAATKKGVSPSVEVRIVETNEGPIWEDPGPIATVEIKNPKKATKMKGIKSFIAYQITPSDSGIQVSRRYKHFDWLYERMAEKFTFVCIPPLPDKQVTGRYEDAFIEKRMEQLQRWMNRMGSHPVISQADVFRHFLSCTDEKKWKQGKRKAEKDDHVGAAFLQVIQAPEKPLDVIVVEKHHDNFSRFQKSMDQSISTAVQTYHDFSKKHTGPLKKEFQKVGHSFTSLAQAFELDTRPRVSDDDSPPQVSTKLTDAMKFTGQTYDSIGQLFAEQPRNDGHRLEDFFREYAGLLSTFPDMINFHKHTISTVKECQRQREEQKIDYEEADSVKKRADVVSYAMMAEINHFHTERVQDFKMTMQEYLTEQIKFYQNITAKLQDALQKYQDI